MKRILTGFVGGVIGAAINIAFLLFAPDLEMEVYIATAVTWVAIGILISVCDFKVMIIIKGIMIAVLVSASSFVYTVTSSLSGAVWTIVNTMVVGAVIGYAVEKVSKITANKK